MEGKLVDMKAKKILINPQNIDDVRDWVFENWDDLFYIPDNNCQKNKFNYLYTGHQEWNDWLKKNINSKSDSNAIANAYYIKEKFLKEYFIIYLCGDNKELLVQMKLIFDIIISEDIDIEYSKMLNTFTIYIDEDIGRSAMTVSFYEGNKVLQTIIH